VTAIYIGDGHIVVNKYKKGAKTCKKAKKLQKPVVSTIDTSALEMIIDTQQLIIVNEDGTSAL